LVCVGYFWDRVLQTICPGWLAWNCNRFYLFFNLFIYFTLPGLELRTYTLNHSTSPFFVTGFFEIQSRKLFAQAGAGFELRFSWSLPPGNHRCLAWQWTLNDKIGSLVNFNKSLLYETSLFSQHPHLSELGAVRLGLEPDLWPLTGYFSSVCLSFLLGKAGRSMTMFLPCCWEDEMWQPMRKTLVEQLSG
jgi:hypothetical protein